MNTKLRVRMARLTDAILTPSENERGHKPRCCKVPIVLLVVAVVFIVVVFGGHNSLLL
jgi:hypothetical protein